MTPLLIRRTSTAGARPSGAQAGELYVNFADGIIGYVDGSGTPIDLPSTATTATAIDAAVAVLADSTDDSFTDIDSQIAAMDEAIDDRMRWMGVWQGGPYVTNEVVTDSNWLAIANKDTTDRPAPIDAGPSTWSMPDAPLWTDADDDASSVTVGLLVQPDSAVKITAVRVWMRIGYIYDVYLVPNYTLDETGPATAEFQIIAAGVTPTADGWMTTAVPPDIYAAGQTFAAFAMISVDPSVVTPTAFTGSWDYQKPGAPTPPSSGQITHAGDGASHLFISKMDNAGTDQTDNLSAMGPGATITMGASVWTAIAVADSGTYIDVTVSPAVQSGTTGPQDVSFDIPVVSTLSHSTVVGQYDGDAGHFGFVSTSGIYEAVPTSNSEGVDILMGPVSFSEDWDLLAYTGAASSGGGGGGGTELPGDAPGYLQNDGSGQLTWTEIDLGAYLRLSGGDMTGALNLSRDNTGASDASLTFNNDFGMYSGGGQLRVAYQGTVAFGVDGDPDAAALNVWTALTRGKGDLRYLALDGGTLTGPLILAGAPTADLHAATKAYVDASTGSGGGGGSVDLTADYTWTGEHRWAKASDPTDFIEFDVTWNYLNFNTDNETTFQIRGAGNGSYISRKDDEGDVTLKFRTGGFELAIGSPTLYTFEATRATMSKPLELYSDATDIQLDNQVATKLYVDTGDAAAVAQTTAQLTVLLDELVRTEVISGEVKNTILAIS